MEKKRSSEEKIKKMQELGIFEKWQANTDAITREIYSRYDFTEDYIKSQQKEIVPYYWRNTIICPLQ